VCPEAWVSQLRFRRQSVVVAPAKVLEFGDVFSAKLRPFEYNVLSRRQVRKRYRFDILVGQAAQVELQEYIDFFAQVRGAPGRTKGMLRVNL